jgi:hypothetical protein
MASLSASVQEIRELGVRGTAFRAWWEFKTRSGVASHLEKISVRRESELTSPGSASLDETTLVVRLP